jgi:hypothetical protein
MNEENAYSDLMTLEGDKGSTYRGRLLCSISSTDKANPKSLTNDIPVDILSNTGPNLRVKTYRLVLAIYDGIDLPDMPQYKKY